MPESKETGFNPADWGGHSRGDACIPTNPTTEYSTYEWATIGQEIVSEIKYGRRVRAFRDNPQKKPIHTFHEGAVFNALAFPPGTIVNFQEQRYDILARGEEDTRSTDLWGITIPDRKGRIHEVRAYIVGGHFGHPYPPRLEIGAVSHTRFVDPFYDGDHFKKITTAVVYDTGRRA